METIELAAITIEFGARSEQLSFASAELVIVSDYGSRLWYANADGITDRELLGWFGQSEDIQIYLRAVARDGRLFEGTAYLHPNELHQAAAIRGDGLLLEG
ncbi:hypothetical protein [Paenibacillus radicis (ex Gao et al. 2016)]|uniref:Uncharacterized protein n=1 Tax=Paenibacillus radicis (ex Gao et al. 2016) TaxID=1737354 RepID=A0A917HFN8_9BACL|nr:hypothetical protein [Paenibacillus radicis (ex Gao et al. 2016)]GGG77666.1 hypothetical protein GCM10010918_38010 [Paenibacillus radicis (ex Gao et al. 2016)]